MPYNFTNRIRWPQVATWQRICAPKHERKGAVSQDISWSRHCFSGIFGSQLEHDCEWRLCLYAAHWFHEADPVRSTRLIDPFPERCMLQQARCPYWQLASKCTVLSSRKIKYLPNNLWNWEALEKMKSWIMRVVHKTPMPAEVYVLGISLIGMT